MYVLCEEISWEVVDVMRVAPSRRSCVADLRVTTQRTSRSRWPRQPLSEGRAGVPRDRFLSLEVKRMFSYTYCITANTVSKHPLTMMVFDEEPRSLTFNPYLLQNPDCGSAKNCASVYSKMPTVDSMRNVNVYTCDIRKCIEFKNDINRLQVLIKRVSGYV